MTELTPVYKGDLYPACWKCTQCQREFRRSPDDVNQTSQFPPVHAWIEFEKHDCADSIALSFETILENNLTAASHDGADRLPTPDFYAPRQLKGGVRSPAPSLKKSVGSANR